jgi:hypothetical protein
MPKDDPPKQAQLFSFSTGQPIDDPPEILEALDLLSRIAGRAMVHGADPSALTSPGHALLMYCDALVMQSRRLDHLNDRMIMLRIGSPERERIEAERKQPRVIVRKLVLKITKLQAQTPSGIFAKAAAVIRSGMTATSFGRSLAYDLLNSPELRRAIWPQEDEK